jgi:hypothetical protein
LIIVAGIRDGKIRTILPLHNNEYGTGLEHLYNHLQRNKVHYARDKKALAEAKAFNLGTGGNNRQGGLNKSVKSVVTRDNLSRSLVSA